MKRGKRILAMVLAIFLVMPMTTAMGAEANTGKLTEETVVTKEKEKSSEVSEKKADIKDVKNSGVETDSGEESPEETVMPAMEEKLKVTPREKSVTKKANKNEKVGINPASLLPLKEKKAYLTVSGYTNDEIKAMSIDSILNMLEDSNGEKVDVPSGATSVWQYKIDEDGIDNYRIYELGKKNKIDLSPYKDVADNQMELIIGNGNQLNSNNIRYIVKIFFSDEIEEEFSFEIYEGDKNGSREKVTPVASDYGILNAKINGVNTPVDSFGYVLEEGIVRGRALINLKSKRAENPHISAKVTVYNRVADITADILNQDMSKPGTGYAVEKDTTVFVVTYFRDGKQYDMKYVAIVIAGAYPEPKLNLYTIENEKKTDVAFNQDTSDEQETSTTQIELKKGYSAKDEFYCTLDYYFAGREEHLNSECKKIVVGHYDSIEETEGLADIKDQLFGTGYKACYGGEGVKFTAFFDPGYITKSGVHKIVVKAVDYSQEWKEFTDAPVVGGIDSWFRITGAEKPNGDKLDTYVIENGKNMNIDTMYGYGYQTVFISENVSSFRPTIWRADTDAISIDAIYIDGREYKMDDVLSFANGQNIINTTFSVVINDSAGRHPKYYDVRFVKRTNGPQLYVAGPLAPDVRSVFLDEYFEYKHDIFVANMGDEEIKDLRLELEATNVALDPYWTIGGEGNDTLAACPENFQTAQASTSYGELPNIAKIRLIPEGDDSGDIDGTLKIYSGSELLATLNLSGRAQNPRITTDKLGNAVKYVPYSYIIATNNMYDWNSVKFSLVSGSLPEGMTLIQDTGEIYGAPLKAGTYNFSVRVDYGREDYFEPSEKNLTITVLENENETVFKTSDDGYAIVPEENGVNGYIGEKVSDYEFVLSSVDEDEVYISGGEYGKFAKLWLNGEELTKGTDYVTDEGSTRITIRSQTLRDKAKEGNNTISAEFNENEKRGESLKRTSQNFRLESLGENNPGENNPGEDNPSNPTVNITTHVVNGNGSSLSNYTVELHSAVITRRTNSSGNATFNGVEMGKHTFYVKNTSGTIVATKGFTLIAGDELSFDGERITARPGQSIEMTITANGSNTSISNVTEAKNTGGSADSTVNRTVNNTTGTKENSSKQVDSAKTGDGTPVRLWLMVSLFTGISVLGLIRMRKWAKH